MVTLYKIETIIQFSWAKMEFMCEPEKRSKEHYLVLKNMMYEKFGANWFRSLYKHNI